MDRDRHAVPTMNPNDDAPHIQPSSPIRSLSMYSRPRGRIICAHGDVGPFTCESCLGDRDASILCDGEMRIVSQLPRIAVGIPYVCRQSIEDGALGCL